MIIQSKNPSLLLMSSTEAFITFLMYFTIENPDIKLMEELEYSKRVAEKSKSETINTLNNIKNELDEPLNQIVNFNDKKIDIEEFLDQQGPNSNKNNNEDTTTENTTDVNTIEKSI